MQKALHENVTYLKCVTFYISTDILAKFLQRDKSLSLIVVLKSAFCGYFIR